ncbi:MAG: ABC transporter substrate-binding protein [Aggregatilineales bacterium]
MKSRLFTLFVSASIFLALSTGLPAAAQQTAPATTATQLQLVGWGVGYAQVYKAFAKVNPNITITERMFNYAEYIPFLQTQFLAGDPPDIVQLMPGASLVQFKDDLLPLDKYIASDPGINVDKFLKPVLATSYVNGQLYGLPQNPSVSGLLWYNADIFTKLGIKFPINYTEWVSVAKACRAGGFLPLAFDGQDDWNRLIVMEQFFNYAAPGKMQQALMGKIKWTDPDLVNAMSFWKKLADDGVFQDGVFGASYTDAFNAFHSGQACMVVAGSWYAVYALKGIRTADIVGNILPGAFPDITNNSQPWTPNINASHVFTIAKNSKHPDEAWQFLRFIGANGDVLASYIALVPSYDSGQSSVLLQQASDATQVKTVEDFTAAAWKLPTQLDEWYVPEIRDAIAQATAGVGTGQISAADAMQSVQDVADRLKTS